MSWWFRYRLCKSENISPRHFVYTCFALVASNLAQCSSPDTGISIGIGKILLADTPGVGLAFQGLMVRRAIYRISAVGNSKALCKYAQTAF